MPRSSKLEPEVQALVDQAARARKAIEGLVARVEERQACSPFIVAHKAGEKSRRYEHIAFDCDGAMSLGGGDCTEAWYVTPEAATDALINVVKGSFDGGMPDTHERCLVWRVLPEVHSITSEIGDLFNAYVRLTVVPIGWTVDFPEDDETPAETAPLSPPLTEAERAYLHHNPISLDEAERPE